MNGSEADPAFGLLCAGKFHSHFDSREIVHQVCGEQVAMRYQQLFAWDPEPHWSPSTPESASGDADASAPRSLVKRARPSVAALSGVLQQAYRDFRSALTPARRALSPIYIHGTGIHYYWDTRISWRYHIQPFLRTAAASSPRPFALWVLNPAPGHNKPARYEHGQGVVATQRYNREMKALIDRVNGPQKDVAQGAWAAVDFYNSTDGASSFDGTHYSYQVAMERAQIFLNYLDIVWSEVVELGGLIEQ